MMKRLLPSLFLLAAISANPAIAQKLTIPFRQAPDYTVASLDKAGFLQYAVRVTRMVPVTRVRVVEKDGERREVKYIAYQTVFNQVMNRKRLQDVEFYNAAGKKLTVDDAKDFLEKPAIVLVSRDGRKVDPFYLKIIKPETLIVVEPRKKRGPMRRGK